MAHVDDPDPDDQRAGRGQLILVTGLAIAVILVALVLLLNTVIYTENVATRGIDPGGGDAIEYRATVVGSVGELIAEENARGYEDYSALESNLTNGTDLFHDRLEERHLERGTKANFSMTLSQGAHIWQDSNQNFENGSDSNWTPVSDSSEIRRFNITVDDHGNLSNESHAFEISMDNGNWSAKIFEYNGLINVTANGDSCDNSSPATIDFTNHTLGGSHCSALDNAPDSGEIEFVNASEISGTYAITVQADESDINSPPQYAMMVYSAELSIQYESRDIVFSTDVAIEGADPR